MTLLQNIRTYPTLAAIPRDLTQQILNELVRRQLLTLSVLHAFLDCSLQVNYERFSVYCFMPPNVLW